MSITMRSRMSVNSMGIFASSLVCCVFFLYSKRINGFFYYDDANETPGPDITEEKKSPRLQNKMTWQRKRNKLSECANNNDMRENRKTRSFNFALDYSRERDLIWFIWYLDVLFSFGTTIFFLLSVFCFFFVSFAFCMLDVAFCDQFCALHECC